MSRQLDTLPDAKELWQGIGGHFDSLTQILAEFIDNSISNFASAKKTSSNIRIDFEKKGDCFLVTLEDTGTGIADLEPVMRLGDKSVGVTYLNEHGFGLKHALASANYDNDSWQIFTRTSTDIEHKVYRSVTAPYSFALTEEVIAEHDAKWPGKFNGTGTIVTFTISPSLFESIQKGIRGTARRLETFLDYLVEDLGYIYAGVIQGGQATIQVVADNEGYQKNVAAVLPQWRGYYSPSPGQANQDLGNGSVTIAYVFGEIEDSSYHRHYKKSQSSQGVELRINGRLILSGLFTEIWGLERHNSYNHFLVQVDLQSNRPERLPQTRTSKNGVRSGDARLEKLYEWIRQVHPAPESKSTLALSEKELVEELAQNLRLHTRASTAQIKPEHRVFSTINAEVYADLYYFDGTESVIYEAKKERASVKEVYQLLMYWDGLVRDGIPPAEGILVATEFPPSVGVVLAYFNTREDANGNPYKLTTRTWEELKITTR